MRVGIFDPYLDSLGGGERYSLTLAEHLSKDHRVEIFWDDETLKNKIKERLFLNLDKTRFVNNIFVREKSLLEKLIKTSNYNLIFFLSDGSIPATLAKKNILHFQTPFVHIKGKTLLNKIKFSRFHRVICNSYFTKRFIDKTYGVKSVVVYPPVDILSFAPGRKRNLILTVGRFTSFFESKKQEIMIKAFKEMVEQGLRDWEFCLVGGLLESDREYFQRLEGQIAGFPIQLLSNIPFSELKKYYGQAKIYWHASGFGEDEEKTPELFEHFGISTVEAMAAGCVPIVFAGGGQKEIVDHGLSGFLWKTKEELIDYTQKVMADEDLRKNLAKEAIKKSKNFSKEVFLRRFDEIIFS